MAETIGFIGLGRMGKSMAANLQKKGFQLQVNDLNQAAVNELVALGAQAAPVEQIARNCSIVVTMLPSSVEVEHIALSPNGIFANAQPGTLLMDMSTIDPLATDKLAKLAAAKGLSMVDAPVGRLAEPLMARSNSPTLGHPKFPQAGPPDYDDSGATAMRAAASLRR